MLLAASLTFVFLMLYSLKPQQFLFYYERIFFSFFEVYWQLTETYIKSIMFALIFYFLSVVSSLLFASFLSLYGVFFINLLALVIFLITISLNFEKIFLNNKVEIISISNVFSISGDSKISIDLILDYLSFNFLLLIIVIALFTLIYSFSYFRGEPNVDRFISFLNFFVLSMIILVLSNNFIVLFFGWEMIGFSSFLLINFWSSRVSTFKSAFKAFIFNKMSDCFLLSAIVIVYSSFSEINFIALSETINQNIFKNISIINSSAIETISVLLFFAACIKSAQIGFHIWLPDSMEAPVPASALIHSATLVSAGIFLILRLPFFFEHSAYFYYLAPLFGIITAFYGGMTAIFQTDLKKILAYSTISHCGFLMFLTIFHSVNLTLFYLFIHGFFKASSFLAVGNIIRFSKDYQDLKKMGGLWKILPFELYSLIFSLTNLAGLPFFFGFFLKTIIASFNENIIFLINIFFYLAFFFSSVYSCKIVYYVFFDTRKANINIYVKKNINLFNKRLFSSSGLANIYSIFFLNILATAFIIFFFYIKIKSIENYYLVQESIFSSSTLAFFNANKITLFNFYVINFILVNLIVLIVYFKFNDNTYDIDYNLFFNNFIILINFFLILK